jgi:hypothetical protein
MSIRRLSVGISAVAMAVAALSQSASAAAGATQTPQVSGVENGAAYTCIAVGQAPVAHSDSTGTYITSEAEAFCDGAPAGMTLRWHVQRYFSGAWHNEGTAGRVKVPASGASVSVEASYICTFTDSNNWRAQGSFYKNGVPSGVTILADEVALPCR